MTQVTVQRGHAIVLIIGIFGFLGCSGEDPRPPSSVHPAVKPQPATMKPIDLANWKETPCLTGRAATVDDVAAGRAMFAAPGSDSKPIDLKLPRCAIHTDEKTGTKVPVIVVQAEDVGGKKTIGFRFLNGGTGVDMLFELQLLDGPDDRFR